MNLAVEQLAQVFRIYMDSAYPNGIEGIPPKKRPYFEIGPDTALCDLLPPAPVAAGVVVELSEKKDGRPGLEFRLGCVHFPHMKLRIQELKFKGETVLVYAVDTHDAFSMHSEEPPRSHPDAVAWCDMQQRNRDVKKRIEDALEEAGYTTFKGLLRRDLTTSR